LKHGKIKKPQKLRPQKSNNVPQIKIVLNFNVIVCFIFTAKHKKDMKKYSVYVGCLTGVFVFFFLPLFASEPDFPDADTIFRDATRIALERNPSIPITKQILKSRIAKRLAERGQFEFMFDYLAKYQGTDKNKGQDEHAYSAFVPIVGKNAFEQGKFMNLAKVLRFVPSNTYYDGYHWSKILNVLVRENRFDEAENILQEIETLPRSDSARQYLSHLKRLYAIFEKDEKGLPVPKLQTVFSQFVDYHQTNYGDKPLLETIFYGHTIPDQVWKAVDLFKEGKEYEAKALFDQAVEKLSEMPTFWMSGMIGNTHEICGVAAFQIELGKKDWAKETLRKAEMFYGKSNFFDNGRRFYPVNALVNIMVALGEMDAARTLIEKNMPLRDDLGTPLIYCDFAGALAKSGDQTGAAEVLRNVMKVAETLDHSGVLHTFLTGLFKAVKRIGDKDLCREFIDRTVQMAEKQKSWDTRNEILGPTVLAQCWLQDFDGARNNLEKMVRWEFDPYFSTFVDSLISLKKYNELESFLREIEKDGRNRVLAWRAIARSKYRDVNKVGALEAINAAIHSAKNDPNGYDLGTPVALIDIAMDIKYSFSEQPGRFTAESVEEIFRWHQELLDRTSTDANGYTEEELLHFLQTVGQSTHSDVIDEKLRSMGQSVYPFIFERLLKHTKEKHWSINRILELIDVSKADRQELRKSALLFHDKYPDYESLYVILGEVCLPEDVPQLLNWKEYGYYRVSLSFQAISKIATASQLPEIEKAAEEAKRLYFEQSEKHPEWKLTMENWNKRLSPEIDKALKTIRERK
jgi:tetratricopeptide (TPR) repeat protein